ncbi:DUF2723 domain-containing protein [Taibaiella lutea]|uniref:DUF2723 domain-containing protein n=1 Tax=Taibaiella lutea TaxID=2608001 RepID=A0A5M6CP99_9BACT|nr:DUF2723 domain-containing protein [Taibaiella lutea]KAA5537061.1 DUF2723 domain-containing protein [Taibaiella lutea]
MNFRKVNNITGWIVFAIAYATYLLTMEATASLWDCGEFLSTAFKLEVGHSPGAPLFMMLGRLFGVVAPSPDKVAIFINSMSALMSGFTILFLFWTITHFAKKLLVKAGEEVTQSNLIAIMSAGIVGALAYTFSDTFWFSAVEGEVYATSSFFTAIVFWAILKWEHVADEPHADRWLILIFYLMGLSIGVHLLNLLTIPAIVMVYYFKRYNVTLQGGIIAFLAGCVVLGFVQFGVIQYLPIFASWFELLFVNSFHMPFNSGAVFFLILACVGLALLIRWAKKSNRYLLHLCSLCVVFIIIGYSSYIAIIIRSKADVAIDMGNPDNVMTLIPYLQRDQYGQQPLVSGPDFTSQVNKVDEGRAIYAAVTDKDGNKSYQLVDHKPEYSYDETRIFPRVWDFNDPGHKQFYRSYLGLEEGERPSSSDNFSFFCGYQMNWMYWRYVMWNYVGRQNDMEGQGESHNGNWLSGVGPIDKFFGKGDVNLMPDSYKHNKARNELYFLPLILGFLGLVFQFNRDRNDGIIVGLLFFFTGTAIVLYLNNTPLQPRERDYAYAGSTYAFAVWIGLGVLMVADWFQKVLKGNMPAIAASLICILAVPVLMAAKEWDDHDRSQKTIAHDHAYNMLMSCDKNAILITYGDNDTYPLWYLQEIEGIRTDIRIINYNLLGTDWQNEQLTFKINDADALPTIWKPEDYRGDKLNYIPYYEDPRIPKNKYFSLEEVIAFFTSDANQLSTQSGDKTNYLPTKNFYVKLDKSALVKSGLVDIADTANIPGEMSWQFKGGNATRGDMALMNIIAGQAKTGWTRPIYMTDGAPNLGLDAYFQSEGPLRKLVPMIKQQVIPGLSPYTNLDKNINLFTKTFTMGKASGKDVYYDEKNRLLFLVYRQNAAELALNLIGSNRKEDAVKVLDRYMSMVSETSMPWDVLLYDRSIMMIVDAYYRAGAVDKGHKIAEKMVKNINDEVKFYRSLGDRTGNGDLYIVQQNLGVLNYLVNSAAEFGDKQSSDAWKQQMIALSAGIPSNQGQ